MTVSQEESTNVRPPRLVANRLDFAIVYGASLLTAVSLLTGAVVLNDPDVSPADLFLPALVSIFISFVPPAVAAFVPSGRCAVQVMFGMALLPIVGAWAVNGHAVFEQFFR